MTTVDRRSPTPLYVQLEKALLAYIRENHLNPGDRLPTEGEIAEKYGVSRQTIRQALMRMVSDGYVERVQGLGSFVAKPRPSHNSLLTSFTQNMRAQGYIPQRQLLRTEVTTAPIELQAAWDLPDDDYQFISRLLLVDGEPLAVSDTWIPVDGLAGRLDLFTPDVLEKASLYELLQGAEIGMRLSRGVETVRASLCTEPHAPLLKCELGSPTLVVRRVSYSPSNRPVEWTVMTFLADRYEYIVELGPAR